MRCQGENLYKVGTQSSVQVSEVSFNPLTIDDTFWRCLTLAACYQLAQSVLKKGSVLAERLGQGEVSGFAPLWVIVHGGCCSWL